MAGSARRIVVQFIGDGKDLSRELDGLQGKTSKFGGVMGKIGKVAGVGLALGGAAALKFGADSVSAASDAQQSLGATETVFGKFADRVIKDSDSAATQFGLSANEYRENANLIGSLFKNQGVSLDELGGKTRAAIGTASDLAATFGGTTKDAVEALGSAFKGEFDPLEKYGISLKASTVTTEAMRITNAKTAAEFGKLTLAQQTAAKQQATNNLIAKQSKDAQGAFARETDTLAHKQQVLAAQFENVKVKVGNVLLPIMTKFMGFLIDEGIPAATKAAAKFREWWPTIEKVGRITGEVLVVLGRFVGWLAEKLWPVIQQTGARLIEGGQMVYKFGQKFVDVIADVARFVKGVKEKTGEAVEFVKGIPGKISDALGDLGSFLYNKGVDLIAGFARGIADKMQDAIDAVKDGLGKIAGLLPGSPIKWGPLVSWNNGGAGKRLMALLAGGIRDGRGLIIKATEFAVNPLVETLQSKLEAAKNALGSLRDQRNQFADFSGFGSNLFGADISGGSDGTGLTGVAALLAFARQQREQAETLAQDVQRLTSMGLSQALIEQLKAQGASGLAQIHALADASPQEVAAINADMAAAAAAQQAAGNTAAQMLDAQLRTMGAGVSELARQLAAYAAAPIPVNLVLHVDGFDGKPIVRAIKVYKRQNGNVELGIA